jgi:hypothetical protein
VTVHYTLLHYSALDCIRQHGHCTAPHCTALHSAYKCTAALPPASLFISTQNLDRIVAVLLLLLLLPLLLCCLTLDADRPLEASAAPGGQVAKILEYVLY